ncbi:MAG: hypothetical protein P4L45_16100 [Ignavibacteriaceae bacterium]|nr:hypothetical protein [Ignavibacteriaceae bacterium]
MDNKVKITLIILSVLIVNTGGLLLKYYGFDAYIIFAGFRFYISLVLPFIIVYSNSRLGILKNSLVHPPYNKTFQPLGWIFLPLIIMLASLYVFKQIEIGDPDYFYEFGLSSIIDYPIYIIWNLPQLLLFGLFLVVIQPALKFNLFYLFLTAMSCFIFAFIPLDKSAPDFTGIISFLFIIASAVLILKYFQNVYWYSIIIFTIIWGNILAFGSSSPTMIHLLCASKYNSWDGFFDVSKNIHQYLLPIQLAITFVFIVFSVINRKTKPDID